MESRNHRRIGSFNDNDLKKYKRVITQNNLSVSSNSGQTNYSFSIEDFAVVRRETEGKMPLFQQIKSERRSSSEESGRAVELLDVSFSEDEDDKNCHPSSSKKSRTSSPINVEVVMKKIEEILDDSKSSSRKRSRREFERVSRSPQRRGSSTGRSRKKYRYCRTSSPRQVKKKADCKYGHSSKDESTSSYQRRFKSKDENINRKRSNSSSSERSDSSVSEENYDKRYVRPNKDRRFYEDSSKYRRSSRRHSEVYDEYQREYRHDSVNDMKERYSRYYAVMYAFSIIMDILRQDDIYSV